MTHPPRHTRTWTFPKFVLVLAIGIVLLGTIPAASYTDTTLPRSSGIDVVTDKDGIYSLETATTVPVGATDDLVRITNTRTTTEVTVTVELQDPPDGVELVVNDAAYGESVTFTIDPDDAQLVELDVPDDNSLDGVTVHYTVDVSGSGVLMSDAEREVTIET